jgi:hypothetical protein
MKGQFFNLSKTSGPFRSYLIAFVISLSIGYGTGLYYVSITTGISQKNVAENYLGNEEDEEAEKMKFKMKEKEILSIIHGHIISFSLIFLAIGFLLFQSSYSTKLISFLSIEPFISIIITFGGIWLMWKGIIWMKYLVIISGTLMHLIFISSIILILLELFKKRA